MKEHITNYPTRELYIPENHEKTFVSVAMNLNEAPNRTLISKLLDHIKSEIECAKVYSLDAREILLSVEGSAGYSFNRLKEVIAGCPDGIGKLVKADIFDLEKLQDIDGYIRWCFSDKMPHFVGVDPDMYPVLIKRYFGVDPEMYLGLIEEYIKN